MTANVAKFVCEKCGKGYLWKAEYAGRLVKCKCGHTIKAPATAGVPAVTSPARKAPVAASAAAGKAGTAAPLRAAGPVGTAPSARAAPQARVQAPSSSRPSLEAVADEFEKAFESGDYDVAAAPAPPVRAAPAAAPRPLAVASIPAGAGVATAPARKAAAPKIGYSSVAGARRSSAVEEEVAKASKVTELYVPSALILIGVIAAFVDAYLHGIKNPGLAVMYVGFTTLTNLVLIFMALLVAVKLLNLGLGPIGPALLKIVAVAILPAAVSSIIGLYTFGFLSWGVSAFLYYGLLYYLFDLDGQEMMIVTSIIWVIRTWAGMLIVFLVLGLIGARLPVLGSGGGIGSSGSSSGTLTDKGAGDENSSDDAGAKEDEEASKLIAEGKAVEAREWLKPEHKNHGGFKMSKQVMLELADKFYAAGAKKVWTAGMETLGQSEICALFFVEMPDAPESRKAVLKVRDDLFQEDTPSKDRGNRYLHVPLD